MNRRKFIAELSLYGLGTSALFFGASKGHGAGHVACTNMLDAADARVRGMRMVVMDPMCNFASAKADEWVPLLPGTDAALALAMINVILNDLQVWDGEFLAAKTNAPYLIGPDGLYLRDAETGKPLIWDEVSQQAVAYDDPELSQPALEGEYSIEGTQARPAFVLLREHVRQFTPQWADTLTSVPDSTVGPSSMRSSSSCLRSLMRRTKRPATSRAAPTVQRERRHSISSIARSLRLGEAQPKALLLLLSPEPHIQALFDELDPTISSPDLRV